MAIVVPTYLKEVDKAFTDLCNGGYYVDVSIAFRDVVEFGIQQFNIEVEQDKIKEIKDRYKGLNKVWEVLKQIILAINTELKDDWDWVDPLGDYYECIAGRSKKSGMGQFFTPKAVCTIMAMTTIQKDDTKDLKINDPTCGSGRTLLAGFVYLKGKAILYAEDLDPICTKMATLNFVMHGARAEVICHNSLNPNSFFFGYKVNMIKGLPPHIRVITAEESEIVSKGRQMLKRAEENEKKGEKPKHKTPKQLKLF